MPTYQRCPKDVELLAAEIMTRFASHKPLLDARVKIDFVFAFPDYDEHTGMAKNDALSLGGGMKALGIARKIKTKERAMGRGDAEVSLDGDWWGSASIDQQAALLDHELHHLEVQKEGNGRFKFDDLNRPKISMRPHDFEFGWFSIIAKRHPGIALECVQAKTIMDKAGQLFWPELGVGGAGASELPPQEELSMSVSVDGGEAVTFKPGQLQRLADALQKAPAEASGETVFDEDEGLIEQCVEVIRTEQKASVSLIQRRLRLGYTRATRIMDELERRGIVGPAKGAEPRDILIGA